MSLVSELHGFVSRLNPLHVECSLNLNFEKLQIDPTAWRLEVERVAPKLRITLNADAKDWRSHLEEVQQHSKVCGCG